MNSIENLDPEVKSLIGLEQHRQQSQLSLIASENHSSPAASGRSFSI